MPSRPLNPESAPFQGEDEPLYLIVSTEAIQPIADALSHNTESRRLLLALVGDAIPVGPDLITWAKSRNAA